MRGNGERGNERLTSENERKMLKAEQMDSRKRKQRILIS